MEDLEKTMQFVMEMQAKHEAAVLRHGGETAEIRDQLERVAQILSTHSKRLTLHREPLDAQERRFEEYMAAQDRRFEAFIRRFDDYLGSRRGNGESR
ncbi:MAG TPA: hypothetical protein VMI06_02550 [Terriglobia bacterium]|nr:hypothetical protein [Terriglobia bacterium]